MSDNISLLFPDKKLDYKKLSDVAVHDIGMDSVIKGLSHKENEQVYIMNVMKLMSDDPYNAGYRADVFDDLYQNKKMREELLELLDKINFLKEYGSFKRDHTKEPGIWDLMHRLDEMKDYIECIEAIYKCLSDTEIRSEGLLRLRTYVDRVYHDNALADLKKDIAELKSDTRNIKSVTVGINVNERFEASGIGVISINNKPFTKSPVVGHFLDKITGGEGVHKGTEWDGKLKYEQFTAKGSGSPQVNFIFPPLSPQALMGIRAISSAEDSERRVTNYMDEIAGRMLSKTVKHLKEVLGKYTMFTITDITDLMPEFIYYIRWAEYIEKFSSKGFAFTKAEVMEDNASDKGMEAEGIYNLKLLEDGTLAGDVVANNLQFEDDKWIYILTGANRGGKTTITQAVGQLFFMAQGGIYVPGSRFCYKPVDGIYTHFPADEDKTLDLGRLGEECKRFKEIYEESTDKSLLLLNETFSTTSFEEGYYIAKDCVKAIIGKGVRTIYNTHMHKLAYDLDEINEGAGRCKAASLVVLNKGEERSYEVKVAPPEGRSYADDIARKYGVTYDMLTSQK
ncbi:MutS-related protein [Butyrivibrio sp. MC2013]|uniref:MutS-related protein n=1 Tax=Butyrivibrio sp. MC2013 TaxID=1280686 RepID=UPI000420B4D3|nr:DNA mismatch repair protein [Butyrivibrio sp. MC2013]